MERIDQEKLELLFKDSAKERKEKKAIMARYLFHDKYGPSMAYDDILANISRDLSFIYGNVSKGKVEEYLFGDKVDKIDCNAIKKANKDDLYHEIRELRKQFPCLKQKRLAEHFNVSISTIKRALRK